MEGGPEGTYKGGTGVRRQEGRREWGYHHKRTVTVEGGRRDLRLSSQEAGCLVRAPRRRPWHTFTLFPTGRAGRCIRSLLREPRTLSKTQHQSHDGHDGDHDSILLGLGG